jgi:hypothetical protein
MISDSSAALVLMTSRLSRAESSLSRHQKDESTFGRIFTQADFLRLSSNSAILCASGSEVVVTKMTILLLFFI